MWALTRIFSEDHLELWARRDFLKFIGAGATGWAVPSLMGGCSIAPKVKNFAVKQGLSPSRGDDISLASGFSYRVLLKWQDQIGPHLHFGSHCDYIDWVELPGSSGREIIMSINHEYFDPLLVSGTLGSRTAGQVLEEMKEVGVSLVHFRQQEEGWAPVFQSKWNRKVTAQTPIPFAGDRQIAGSSVAIGTLANCAGGKTPDGKILTCEENYDLFFGEVTFRKSHQNLVRGRSSSTYGWERFFDRPPEHYGWVVEIDPMTGTARKLPQLGRFAHESATVTVAPDGRWVIYSGDDKNDEHLYKFVSDGPHLESGTLYVAQLETGRWIPLSFKKNPSLKTFFRDETEMLIRTREAARLVGATPMDRPEDIAIRPGTQNVIVALTNNKPKGNHHGSLLQIREHRNNPTSEIFEFEVLLTGGPRSGLSCPDNLEFDQNGDLWVTTDRAGDAMDKEPYLEFGNNGLFYVPLSGPEAGRPLLVASAPIGAEFTGPKFSPDGTELFLAVQHPGEDSESLENLKSHWPDGGSHLPKSSVISIRWSHS